MQSDTIKTTLNGTAFRVTHQGLYGESNPDTVGDAVLVLPPEQAARVAKMVHVDRNRLGDSFRTPLGENDAHTGGEDGFGWPYAPPTSEPWDEPIGGPEDPQPLRLGVDGMISALALLAQLGPIEGEDLIALTVESDSSPFWILHDFSHARNDWSADAEAGEAEGLIDGPSQEDRANVDGFLAFVEQGGDPGEALAEIISTREQFRERFNGTEPTAVATILEKHADKAVENVGEYVYLGDIEPAAVAAHSEFFDTNPFGTEEPIPMEDAAVYAMEHDCREAMSEIDAEQDEEDEEAFERESQAFVAIMADLVELDADDKVAWSEAWSDYIDQRQADGKVTGRQRDSWDAPEMPSR